jgi:dipeptidyl aminopeptidase/acylaminoacyl peptidase
MMKLGISLHAGRLALLLLVPVLLPAAGPAAAQGTLAEYRRAAALPQSLSGLTIDVAQPPAWIGSTNQFTYRKSVRGGNEFVRVDAVSGSKAPAFDHTRLAVALSAAAGRDYTAVTLPFSSFEYRDGERSIEFTAANATWRCDLTAWTCARPESAAPGRPAAAPPEGETVRRSPDGRYEALVRNSNIAVRRTGSRDERLLSHDGAPGNAYTAASIRWSPDSRRLAAYRVTPGYRRMVPYIESSPADQLQPKLSEIFYRKPGDVLDVSRPVLFDVEEGRRIEISSDLFPNAYSMSQMQWRRDGRAFTFEYNERGHQVYRVIEVNATTGAARAVISEETPTFFSYRPANGSQTDSGTRFRQDIDDGREILWMSERDGWRHLYLYDGVTGAVKNRITSGEWVVRAVDSVDVRERRIWFRASGVNPQQDPYFVHYFRVNFDGTGLVAFTEADGNHIVSFSPDGEYYVNLWSRVDLPTIAVLRRTSDRTVVMELERGDMSAQLATGWRPPEVFSAKGRDGTTDIWGVIVRPTNFDPNRVYPVVEYIYAGPQGSFVPKSFSPSSGLQPLAELGFIVVQIDGMGTANRSKAFHDVAWQNLGDAGFPDRILWHQAVARKYAYYDITRVGIYGSSAGGQNALGGLLFHPEFYTAAVSAVGCHDNRMDKIWWNEQWMGSMGPHYEASSNVVHAHRLQGRLLLVVGEMDTNVDPASTMQVVNALVRARKDFELLVIPGAGHGTGGDYGTRRRYDFFVRHLLGVTPPDWNQGATADAPGGGPPPADPGMDFLHAAQELPSFFDAPDELVLPRWTSHIGPPGH